MPRANRSSRITHEQNPMSSTKPRPSQFSLLYFASAASFTKKEQEHFDAPLPLSKLFSLLDERYPGIKHQVLDSCAVTVNLEYVDVNEDETDAPEDPGQAVTIKAGDEVAIIPPVSSG
ncbi:MAG: hypothetical protein M1833_006435 [Piccolia ochrophora]|nr:MAG: hypothetical protein M1833_006435 [Piccolia ochrophora]